MRTLLTLTLTAGLFGHDLYLRPRIFRLAPGQAGEVEFHNGEAFPNSQVPPVLARLRGMKVLSPKSEQPLTGVRIVGKAALGSFNAPESPAFLVVGETTPNYIELPAPKFEEYLAHESLVSISEWRKAHGEASKPGREMYSKYVKAILHTSAADAFVTKPVGQTIEFVPMVDPASLKPGDKLTVRILFRGSPAADLHVEASSATGGAVKERQLGRTDREGKIDIPLDVPGLWKLHAIRMERRQDTAKADWESFWASLTFEVKQ
jgi:hypothetical protein